MKKAIKFKILFLLLVTLPINYSIASEIQYPYFASPERERTILDGYKKIKIGMTLNEVIANLGEPDEIRDLYSPINKKDRKIGFTYWYLIQRIKKTGSQKEKNEKLVRISFGLNSEVIQVDKW